MDPQSPKKRYEAETVFSHGVSAGFSVYAYGGNANTVVWGGKKNALRSHDSEKRLIKKCRELNQEIVSNATKATRVLVLWEKHEV